jgi:uncharacterized protein (DUF427 family)
VEPGPGQESVWDYPRPPALVGDERLVEVYDGAERIASSRRACRVLETASPPTFYLPPEDVDTGRLAVARGSSFCEWKGRARYWRLARTGEDAEPVAWTYPAPTSAFAAIAGWYAFYPGRVRCLVDGELVRAQAGAYYGGWVTGEIVGPFKGDAGTGHW